MKIAELKKMTGVQLLAETRRLVKDYENQQYVIGGALAHIQDSLGKGSKFKLREYMESQLGLHYRKGMYLLKIYRQSVGFGYTERQMSRLITALGWTKTMRVMNKLTSKVVVSDLIEHYSMLACSQINPLTDKKLKLKMGKEEELVTYTFVLPKRHARRLEVMLEDHGLEYSGNSRRRGVSLAMQHFLEELEQ